MKIKKLKLNNFAKFTDFEIDFDGKLTRLIGLNGSGKTTIGLTSIWAGLKGIAEKSSSGQLIGERWRFIGSKKPTADIEITLLDTNKNAEIKIKNHISKQSNSITFEAPENYSISNEWLENILSVAFLSSKNFTSLNSLEQALLLGIDTSDFDYELRELKDEYTFINRAYRDLGDREPVEETKKVNIGELIDKKSKIDMFNQKQNDVISKRKFISQQINDLENRLIELKNKLENLPQPEKLKDFADLDNQINSAEEINSKAQRYENYIIWKEDKDNKKDQLKDNKAKQESINRKRTDYIKSFKFDFKGLEIDDDGGLVLDGRPIKEQYFSKGELEIIVAKLYASLNPDLKIRFIDDFELLDENNQKKIVKELTEQDFQIITAEVSQDVSKSNAIFLRECKMIDKKQLKEESKKSLL